MEVLLAESFDDVQEYLNKSTSYMVCDIETTSLTVGKGRIICIAFADYNTDDALVWWTDNLDEIAKLRLPRAVFHNSHFDARWLRSYSAKVRTVWDTMVMAHLIDENHRSGLKELGQRLLGYEDWTESEITNLENLPRERVTGYVAKDVIVTRALLRWQMAYLKKNLKPGENPLYVMRKIILPAIKPLTQMEDNRLPIRIPKVKAKAKEVSERMYEIERELDSLVPPEDERPDWIRETKPKWGNTNFTKWFLFVHEGVPCLATGKPTATWPDGNPSLASDVLNRIDHPVAKLLMELSTLKKSLTAFLIPLLERNVEGRVATSFRVTGTVTGRLSSASPGEDNPGINSQQIPRDKGTRTLFGEKGQAWIECDYSQLELRVASVMAQEHTMMDLFAKGEDIHLYMAKKLVKSEEISYEQRALAKGVNFGFLYGMQAKHFADYLEANYGVIINSDEAEAFREEYFATFNCLPKWYKKQRAFALEHGGVPNAFGRFRHLPKVYSEDYWVQENAFRQAINSPVQATGSDFMLISLGKVARDEYLTELGAKLITTVHDSVCLTAPYATARKVAKRIKAIMETADETLEQDYFLKADATISHSWGSPALAEY